MKNPIKINLVIMFALFIILNLIINISALENYANSCPMGGATYDLNGGYGSVAMILNWIISLLLIILIVAGIYWFIKSANRETNSGKK